MILWKTVGEPVDFLRTRLAGGLARLGILPGILTFLGFPVSLGAAFLFAWGQFRWAAAAILLACALDMLDGSVARAAGKTSRLGAFLDSSIDRYSDAAIFGGVIVHYLLSGNTSMVLLGGSALVGALLVSYTRARAECFIESCKVGFFERGERLAMLMLGAFFANMPTAFWILATLTHWTVLVRIHHTWRTLSGRTVPSSNTLGGQLYHIVFWDFDRGSIQFDVLATAAGLCSAFLKV
jgi:CDP-diacylglycerol--glycerol-3-phosphate 3-phosphatidyltransferase